MGGWVSGGSGLRGGALSIARPKKTTYHHITISQGRQSLVDKLLSHHNISQGHRNWEEHDVKKQSVFVLVVLAHLKKLREKRFPQRGQLSQESHFKRGRKNTFQEYKTALLSQF